MKNNMPNISLGFTMPAILIVSSALFVIGLSTLQAALSIQRSVNNQYYAKLAQEAAEAGTAYAYGCLEANSRIQSWGPSLSRPPLTQKTDCMGVDTYPYTGLLSTVSNIKVTFSIGDLEFREEGTLLIAATSQVNVMNASGTTTVKSFSHTMKKAVSWQNLIGGKSAAGTNRTCGLISGSAYCWGLNANGQLGDGTTTTSYVPVKVVRQASGIGSRIITNIAAGTDHTCAIAAAEAFCWGSNYYGQLGNGSTTGTGAKSTVPVKVTGLLTGKTVTAIGTSTYGVCAIADGEVYCWGGNRYGELGNDSTTGTGSTARSNTPVKVIQESGLLLGKTATTLSSSGTRTYNMCTAADGLAYCWGNNAAGEVGDGTTTMRTKPVAVLTSGVLSGKTVTALSTDGRYNTPGTPSTDYGATCAVASGEAFCWGKNINGKLGNNGTSGAVYSSPVAVSTSGVLSGKTVTEITVGSEHACVLADQKVYCWGSNGSGQLGTNDAQNYSKVPVAVVEQAGAFLNEVVTNLGGGANRACGTAGGKNFCWGLNNNGQIGDGTTIDRYVPVESIFLRPRNNVFIF